MHSFRRYGKWVRAAVFLALCLCTAPVLDFLLKPSNIVRLTMHQMEDGRPCQDLFLGTSHGQYGLDTEGMERVTGRKTMNLCMADAYPVDLYYLLRETCSRKTPDRVIYECDPAYLVTDEPKAATSMFFYQEMPWSFNKLAYWAAKISHLDFRETLFGWGYYRNQLPHIQETVRTKLSAAYRNYEPGCVSIPAVTYKGRGFSYREPQEVPDMQGFIQPGWTQKEIRRRSLHYLEKMIRFCKEKGIRFQMVVFPVPKGQNERYSDDKAAADRFLKKFAAQNNISYYNFNTDPAMKKWNVPENFCDQDGHMCGPAAEKFSVTLGKYLCQRKTK